MAGAPGEHSDTGGVGRNLGRNLAPCSGAKVQCGRWDGVGPLPAVVYDPYTAWQLAEYLRQSGHGVGSVFLDESDDGISCLLRLFFHDPMARAGNNSTGNVVRDQTHDIGHLGPERMIAAER